MHKLLLLNLKVKLTIFFDYTTSVTLELIIAWLGVNVER